MSETVPLIRPGRLEDAALIARLANRAAEGMPLLLWRDLANPGEDAWAAGIRRVESPNTPISYTNTWIAELDGDTAGCLILHDVPANPDPVADDELAMFVPLRELERLAPETRHIYVVSTAKEMRGRGVGGALLRFAEQSRGPKGMSLIVSDANLGARRLYERHGFRESDKRPMVKIGWENPGEYWVLMVKS